MTQPTPLQTTQPAKDFLEGLVVSETEGQWYLLEAGDWIRVLIVPANGGQPVEVVLEADTPISTFFAELRARMNGGA